MHLDGITLFAEKFPTKDHYPFNLTIFQNTSFVPLTVPVTFFIGENGTGKSTLLRAISNGCRIHRWRGLDRARSEYNPHEEQLYRALEIHWTNGSVPGSFFSSQQFQEFAKLVDDWTSTDPGLLEYFGGRSLMTQSHGQVLMAFFRSRYGRKGLYLLDEPETALSPKSQLSLLKLLIREGFHGQAQFVIATHSPILLACPGARILGFDDETIGPVAYEQTEYYRFYRDFLTDREKYLGDLNRDERS